MSSTTVATRPERVTALPPGAARRAVRDIAPIAVAVVPFGTVVGVTLDQAALVGVPALVVTGLVYAGSAQLATLAVLIAGGGPIGAVIAGAMVNARLVLYSAGHGHRFRAPGHPAWFRWLAPVLTVDQTFALADGARDLRGVDFRRYWMTMGTVLGAVWLTAVAVGMVLGSVLPEASPMDVAIPATMVSLLAPHLRSRRLRRAALVAAVVGVVGASVLPSGLGIVAAIVAGMVAAGSEEVAR